MVFVLPTRKSLDLNWNYGSILGMVLVFQIFTGLFLSIYYIGDRKSAFLRVQYIIFYVTGGWSIRILHFNGASLFFVFIYMHVFKGVFNCSYRLVRVWIRGIIILLMVFVEAFMGYVLVWAQIRFWACIVITSLLRVVPYVGLDIVVWIWGRFFTSRATLKFFFVIHFILPWLMLVVVMFHLMFLHETGRTSLVGVHGDYDKVTFFPFYWLKDAYNLLFWLFFVSFSFFYPFFLGDPEMFLEATISSSPVHIKPEWYFLFAYAILRAFHNKSVGIFYILISIIYLFFLVMIGRYTSVLDYFNDFFVWGLIGVLFVLTWAGNCPLDFPYIMISFIFTFLYFFFLNMIFFGGYLSKYIFWYI